MLMLTGANDYSPVAGDIVNIRGLARTSTVLNLPGGGTLTISDILVYELVNAPDPHTIVSITDPQLAGNAVVQTAGPHGLTSGDFIFSTNADYPDVFKVTLEQVNDQTTQFVLCDPFTGIPISHTVDSTGGTWAAVTQHVDTYTTDQTLDTSAWVGQAVLECIGKCGDGDLSTGGGGGAYAKTSLLAPFADSSLDVIFLSESSRVSGNISGVLTSAHNGSDGDTGGQNGTGGQDNDCTGDVKFSGGNGGTLFGGGGGAATKDGPGQNGGDGDADAVGGTGGLDGSGNVGGGHGEPAAGGDNGENGGGGAGPALGGTGTLGKVVVTSHTLT